MTPKVRGPALTLPVGARDHVQGPANAPVTVVEYGDYECIHCARAHPIVRSIQKRLGQRLRFVYRHFPLSEGHPHAENAAEAAEAAGAQGKFWEMHDVLFDNQDALEPPDLMAYAKRVGADPKRVAAEIESHVHTARVREDFRSGVKSGVNGTPTFFVNGVRFDGLWEQGELYTAIEAAIEAGV
jgi:protein-disulfide isomerase